MEARLRLRANGSPHSFRIGWVGEAFRYQTIWLVSFRSWPSWRGVARNDRRREGDSTEGAKDNEVLRVKLIPRALRLVRFPAYHFRAVNRRAASSAFALELNAETRK